MSKHLIVIGGVAAGMSAAAKAKRVDRDMEAIVYEKGPYISYAACGMPYFIAGDVADYRDIDIQEILRRMEQVARGVSAANHTRAQDAAKLLGIPFMCTHTAADNCVAMLRRSPF